MKCKAKLINKESCTQTATINKYCLSHWAGMIDKERKELIIMKLNIEGGTKELNKMLTEAGLRRIFYRKIRRGKMKEAEDIAEAVISKDRERIDKVVMVYEQD